jgi:glycosyltransferase involved in cell wall biosynthesis
MLMQILVEHRRSSFDVFHALWAVPQGVVAAAASRITNVPVILQLPGGDLANLPDIRYGGMVKARSRAMVRFAVGNAARVVVATRYMSEQANKLGIETVHVPNGLPFNEWPLRAPRRRDPGATANLLYVGNLNEVKNPQMILRAARRLRDRGLNFQLDIVGYDTLKGRIQRLAADLGILDLVTFHGQATRAETRAHMERADLLLLTSHHDAGPVVVIEAAAVGVPTVGTAIGTISEWAPDAAMVVPSNDDAALAHEVETLLADEPRRMRLAMNAYARVQEVDADATAGRLLELSQEVVQQRAESRAVRRRMR